jgi:glycosyltransferase involved in cell wall biosynthesis
MRPKILISAYACEPNRGSEPEVGWRWANLLAEHVDLHILTRCSNRKDIVSAIDSSSPDSPIRNATFIYYDLPNALLFLKKKKILPTSIYYILWQWLASRRYSQMADGFDIVHHLTFCSILCPGFWKLKNAKFVVGPIGAPLVNSHYLRLFGLGCFTQWLRGLIIRNFHRLPWLFQIYRNAAAVIPANTETELLLQFRGIQTTDIILDTGAPLMPKPANPKSQQPSTLTLIYAGQLERRKGLELLLRAVSALPAALKDSWKLDIFGRGPDHARLTALIQRLSLTQNVFMRGFIPREALLQKLSSADAFAFCSVRDTSAGVNLEAMACGLPIICIAHQGIADITDESCALRVVPSDIQKTVSDLTTEIQKLIHSPSMSREMGTAARRRALQKFTWEAKLPQMLAIYGVSAKL